MAEDSKCEICQKPAPQKCSGCHTVHYCSKEHQKVAWKSHRKVCKPFMICEDEFLGRYLVATKPLKPGDVVIKEDPLIWGPSQITVPVCLGCGVALSNKTARPCQKCGWPMCSEICQNSPSHIPECSYTTNRGDKVSIKNFNIPHPSYQCITVLRCLYQKQFLSNVWNKIQLLESHCKERKLTSSYQQDKRQIVEFIKRFFKIDTFSEEEILKVCGIVMINAHEVPLNEPPHIAIYETTSMLEHSCRANCAKSFTSKGGVLVSAGTHIEKGEHLSICYTDPLWGTPNRRHHLWETKFFWCNCSRCSDSTEFGTYFSAVRCQEKDCKGYLLPKSFQEDSDLNARWYCDVCPSSTSSVIVHETLDNIGRQLNSMPKGILNVCRVFLRENEKYLSPNHYYFTDVKFALCQLIGQDSGLQTVSDEEVEFKAKLCRQLIDMMKILIPAEPRVLGILLFELHAAISEIGRRKVEAGLGGPDDLQDALMVSVFKFLWICLEKQNSFVPKLK
ncbi:set and mynd domain containing arthropod-specific member 4 isoform a [Holotrichia oblita]|uniref:Set and mynd domain containing arthropod-specific member 4 isoform a n=1 Tax=Holotrichia oblita TaxID=644536 RepID=A0ACB9SSI6_HOLOL|nr:set and mynd domain containing arthropod-specific member 4 isoform a [Holotrichia oblita]